MKKTRYIIALVLACIMLLSLTACGGGGETAPETSEPGAATTDPSGGETTDPDVEKKEFNIAMILQTLSNPFYVDMEKGANERVAEYENEGISITLEISAPQKETDSEAVVDFFANAITKQVDAICIVPGDTQSIIPSLLDANAAGIPVVTIDSKLDGEIMEKENAEIVAWVGSDNIEGGRIAGRAMGELFKDEEGTVEIAVIEGIAGHTTAEGRKQGFGEGLAEYSNCEIVSS
ncbi:MAG: substrate-binding domain-containing protein, partial [Christensenellales bacterium]